jgi:predicted lipase
MYVRMYVYINVLCMYLCMYVCMCVSMYVSTNVRMYVFMYACMHVGLCKTFDATLEKSSMLRHQNVTLCFLQPAEWSDTYVLQIYTFHCDLTPNHCW